MEELKRKEQKNDIGNKFPTVKEEKDKTNLKQNKILNEDNNDLLVKRVGHKIEERDTSGDTKIFKAISRKDIEVAKRKQNIIKKNEEIKLGNNKSAENNIAKNEKKLDVDYKYKNNEIVDGEVDNYQKSNSKKSFLDNDEVNNNNKINGNIKDNNLEKYNKLGNGLTHKLENNKEIDNSQKVNERLEKDLKSNKAIIRVENKDNKANSKSINNKVIDNRIVNNRIKNNSENNKLINKKQNDNKKVNSNQSNIKTKTRIKVVITLLIAIILLIIGIVSSTIFGFINLNSSKVVKGVKVNNIEISGLTKEEACMKLNDILNNGQNNYIIVKHGDYTKEIKLEDIQGKFDVESSVNIAYNIGRENNIVQNNFNTIKTMIEGNEINTNFSYNQELLENKMNEISLEIPDLATEASYIINDNKVIIKNSRDGVAIESDSFFQDVVRAFTGVQKDFELPVKRVEKKEIDIESIHNEIYKEPINASYTTNPYQIFKEENGLDFAISMGEVKKMLAEDKEEYEIKLKVLKPRITVNNLNAAAFPDVLSTFTTNYGTGDAARNTNIALAAKSINSVVVMPGEVFSYNDLIGECSTRTGYKESTIYENGKLSKGIGGGICQVSTTLYNAVLRANLEIVQRRNHSLGVTYVPSGQDAMVNIGSSDFKFKNNRDYPIKVIAYTGTGSITCQIQGLKQDVEYEVRLESRTIEKTDTRYKVETYKVLYLNGKAVSRTWLSTDTYKNH